VQAGDVILAVGGVPTAGQPLDAVVGRIRGPAGTPVVISFQRGGQSFELTMRRKLLNL
jgi:C-terminal processing protease CtpA/Prc